MRSGEDLHLKGEVGTAKTEATRRRRKNKGCYEISNGQFFCQNIFKKVQEDVMKSVARGIDPEDIMPGISYFLVNGKDKNQNRIRIHMTKNTGNIK